MRVISEREPGITVAGNLFFQGKLQEKQCKKQNIDEQREKFPLHLALKKLNIPFAVVAPLSLSDIRLLRYNGKMLRHKKQKPAYYIQIFGKIHWISGDSVAKMHSRPPLSDKDDIFTLR